MKKQSGQGSLPLLVRFAALILLTMKPTFAQAPDPAFYDSGNALYEGCIFVGPMTDVGYSTLRYIVGFTDAMTLERTWGGQKGICVAAGVTARQLYDVTCQYMAAHPVTRNMQAAYLVTLAEQEAFPCAE